MGLWSGIKYALNSTLGTDKFMPLDRMVARDGYTTFDALHEDTYTVVQDRDTVRYVSSPITNFHNNTFTSIATLSNDDWMDGVVNFELNGYTNTSSTILYMAVGYSADEILWTSPSAFANNSQYAFAQYGSVYYDKKKTLYVFARCSNTSYPATITTINVNQHNRRGVPTIEQKVLKATPTFRKPISVNYKFTISDTNTISGVGRGTIRLYFVTNSNTYPSVKIDGQIVFNVTSWANSVSGVQFMLDLEFTKTYEIKNNTSSTAQLYAIVTYYE